MTRRQPKYVFITGGVVSSLGKGLAAASIGALMENRGLKVQILKLDPYINVDPGTMSPFQHGEVFVTDDGAETDLDLGHYERFTNAQPIFRAGVRVDARLRPILNDGSVAYQNLFAAGSVICGYDHTSGEHGLGECLATGHLSGTYAAELRANRA